MTHRLHQSQRSWGILVAEASPQRKEHLSSHAPPESTSPRAHAVWVTGTAPPPLLPRCVQALSAPLLTGSIPGPIAFGWVIDKACLLWQDQCGQQGSCFVYQNSAMSWYLLIAGLGYKVSRAASPQGHCGGGVGALESIPKSQESSPTSSRVWAAPGFFQQLHPPLEGLSKLHRRLDSL